MSATVTVLHVRNEVTSEWSDLRFDGLLLDVEQQHRIIGSLLTIDDRAGGIQQFTIEGVKMTLVP